VKGPRPETRAALRDVNHAGLLRQPVADARTKIESRGDLRPNRITVVHGGEVIIEVNGFG